MFTIFITYEMPLDIHDDRNLIFKSYECQNVYSALVSAFYWIYIVNMRETR